MMVSPLPPPCTFSTALVDGKRVDVLGWDVASMKKWAADNGLELPVDGTTLVLSGDNSGTEAS